MSKVTLEYNLPEEHAELACAANGHKWKSVVETVIADFSGWSEEAPSPTWEGVVERIRNIVKEHNLELD